jgi:hypothetical protein
VGQIGFLTEWQLYAQKIEGDQWLGEKLDEGKISKMSGMLGFLPLLIPESLSWFGNTGMLTCEIDEQLGQLYELMKAIQKRGTEGGEPES